MIGHFNYQSILILVYTLVCIIINIQALVERVRKKTREKLLNASPPSWIKFDFNFFIITFVALMCIRGLVFLLAMFLIKNVVLKVVSMVFLAADFISGYGMAFNDKGEAQSSFTITKYVITTVHLFLQVSFMVFFFVYYLINTLYVL